MAVYMYSIKPQECQRGDMRPIEANPFPAGGPALVRSGKAEQGGAMKPPDQVGRDSGGDIVPAARFAPNGGSGTRRFGPGVRVMAGVMF